MNWQTGFKNWLAVAGLAAALAVGPTTLFADDKPLNELVTRLARDIRLTQDTVRQVEPTKKVEFSAFSKEASTVGEMKRFVSQLSTADDLKMACENLKQFGYRITTLEESKAFHQTMQLLEERCKFLARTEDPTCATLLDSFDKLRTDVDGKAAEGMRQGVRDRVQRQMPAPALELSVQSARTSGTRSGPRAGASRSDSGLNLLGANVVGGKTEFSVYSPNATAVTLALFEKPEDTTGKNVTMTKGNDGIWRTTVASDLTGKFYGFYADGPTTPGHLFDPKRLLNDPYAKANVDHDGKSVVVNDKYTWNDSGWKTPPLKDLIIYEMHVKDFTAHDSAKVPATHKGRYTGLVQGEGTDRMLGHLVDLGVNAVELLPCHEFDNNFAGHMNHWGYMTSHYFAPECNFASNKVGKAVPEFKTMVDKLHQNGIAVIMDVVFNHTTEGNEQGTPINFKGFDNPGYYRLCDNPKFYWNGTGCGNEFRSESPMGRKLILDSLKYWVKEYHVDGFRFDLATIIDKDTINAMINELPPSTILIAEPWAADWKRNQWGKSDFKNTKWAKWNDDFRENVRAFAKGGGSRNDLMTVLAGSCFWWTAKPTESVNYIEAHDGGTINDILGGNKGRFKVAMTALLTAQGVPMLQAGQELMKSKKGNDNSYDQDNDINWINWDLKKTNADLYAFVRGLIKLRRKYECFKHTTPLNSQNITWLEPGNQRAVGYLLKGMPNILVLLNSDANEWVTFNLPDGNDWSILCNGDKVADDGSLGTAKGDYRVPPLTAIILKHPR